MKLRRIIQIGSALAAVLFLAGCILQPSEDATGTISLAVSAPDAGISASALNIGDQTGVDPSTANVARLWMYANGGEYRLAPTSADASSSRNYVEASLDSGTGQITIDGIPAGEGYSVVVVLGRKVNDVFVPMAYARSGRFAVNAGLETVVSPSKVALVGDTDSPLSSASFSLIGENLNSVLVSGGIPVTASSTKVWTNGSELSLGSLSPSPSRVYSVSVGDSGYFVNTDKGIAWSSNGGLYTTSNTAGITDVTYSSSFFLSDTSDRVVFYQRLGGLGGVVFNSESLPAAADWQDFGPDDLQDLVDPDASPVRAMASGNQKGFFATAALDNFMVTRTLFDSDSDIEAADLISGEAEGVTFFNVPYPGTTRPMRIDEMAVVTVNSTEYLAIGTPRGAFVFPVSTIGSSDSSLFDSTRNLVNSNAASFRSLIRDEPVAALNSEGGWLAIATSETVTLLNMTNGIPTSREDATLILPRRGVTLGQTTGLAIDTASGTLYIAGTEGISAVKK